MEAPALVVKALELSVNETIHAHGVVDHVADRYPCERTSCSDVVFVSVGNILDSTDVRSTGALEPPDFFVSEMQRVRRPVPHGFLTTPLGVFARWLDSALVHEGPRAPPSLFWPRPV